MKANANRATSPVVRPWFLYLIECCDGSLYTGVSVNVSVRYAMHARGKGARYTRSHTPRCLLGTIEYADRSSALSAEYAVKKMSAPEKRAYMELLALAALE